MTSSVMKGAWPGHALRVVTDEKRSMHAGVLTNNAQSSDNTPWHCWRNPLRRRATCAFTTLHGQIPKWTNGTDCKSVGLRLRRFESYSGHRLTNVSRRSIRRHHPFICPRGAEVAHNLGKVGVMGSNPIAGSNGSPLIRWRRLAERRRNVLLCTGPRASSIFRR